MGRTGGGPSNIQHGKKKREHPRQGKPKKGSMGGESEGRGERNEFAVPELYGVHESGGTNNSSRRGGQGGFISPIGSNAEDIDATEERVKSAIICEGGAKEEECSKLRAYYYVRKRLLSGEIFQIGGGTRLWLTKRKSSFTYAVKKPESIVRKKKKKKPPANDCCVSSGNHQQ